MQDYYGINKGERGYINNNGSKHALGNISLCKMAFYRTLGDDIKSDVIKCRGMIDKEITR